MKKITLLFLVLVCTAVSWAQNTPVSTISFSFNHVALSVKEVDRSVAFYTQVLQLKEITNRTQKDGIRWVSLGEDKELHLVSTIKIPVTLNKAIHFALTTPNFDAFIKNLDALKIPYSDWAGSNHVISIRADGIQQVYIQDPDGYWIEINSVAQH